MFSKAQFLSNLALLSVFLPSGILSSFLHALQVHSLPMLGDLTSSPVLFLYFPFTMLFSIPFAFHFDYRLVLTSCRLDTFSEN
jgi:hypothetical protein